MSKCVSEEVSLRREDSDVGIIIPWARILDQLKRRKGVCVGGGEHIHLFLFPDGMKCSQPPQTSTTGHNRLSLQTVLPSQGLSHHGNYAATLLHGGVSREELSVLSVYSIMGTSVLHNFFKEPSILTLFRFYRVYF